MSEASRPTIEDLLGRLVTIHGICDLDAEAGSQSRLALKLAAAAIRWCEADLRPCPDDVCGHPVSCSDNVREARMAYLELRSAARNP